MKKLAAFFLALMFLMTGTAFAQTDEAWRAQQTAGQGFYVEGLSQEEIDALTQTTIIKTDDSPTGWLVAFRYHAPEATRVRIRGEWSMSKVHEATGEHITYYTPEEWTKDMFVMIPDIQGDWFAYEMTLNKETGTWCYTIPLYTGTWSYRFIEGGVKGADMRDYTDAYVTVDPNNRPFELTTELQGNSQVRVPDNGLMNPSLGLQLPIAHTPMGISEIVTYPVTGVPEVADGAYELCIYTPYGYEAERTKPYKVAYVSHGGGTEGCTSWYNKGSLSYILDNMIAKGRVEPMVVVMIDNYSLGFNDANLIDNILPFVEQNYNVSTEKRDRALCGLSAGSSYTRRTMLAHPELFGYWGLFSSSADPVTEAFNAEALKNDGIFVGIGTQEFMAAGRQASRSGLGYTLGRDGLIFEFWADNGGHQWTIWRDCFVAFCEMTLWK